MEVTRMTAFAAYWLALKTGLATLRSAHRTYWQVHNADH